MQTFILQLPLPHPHPQLSLHRPHKESTLKYWGFDAWQLNFSFSLDFSFLRRVTNISPLEISTRLLEKIKTKTKQSKTFQARKHTVILISYEILLWFYTREKQKESQLLMEMDWRWMECQENSQSFLHNCI